MPIQLPEVKRIDPQGPVSVGRLDATVPDVQRPMAQQNAALQDLASEGLRYRNQVADQTADTTATNKENSFEQWHKEQIYGDPGNDDPSRGPLRPSTVGLKFRKGDPTENYRDFEKQADDKLKDLSTPDSEQPWDQETQNLVNRRLNKKAEQLRLESLTEYGHAQSKYDDGITESGVKINQQALPGATTFIQAGDESTLAPLQTRLTAMRNLRIAQALRYGGAKEDENGMTPYTAPDGRKTAVTLGPATQLQIKKDLSDGLYGAMDNLVKVGNPDALAKVDFMKEKFGDLLDPLHKDKLTQDYEKSRVDAAAFALAAQAKGTSNPDAIMGGVDEKVRHKALQIINEDQRNVEAIKQRSSKSNYQPLAEHVMQVMRSDTPFEGVIGLEQDPMFKAFAAKVTDPKQLQAIYHMVDQPKESSKPALNKMVGLFMGQDPNNDIKGMSQTDFELYKANLSKPDQRKYQNMYEKMNIQSDTKLDNSYKQFGKEFDQQAIGALLLRKLPNSNYLIPSDQIRSAQYKKELLDSLDGLPPMGPKERSDYVAKFVADKMTGNVFKPPEGQKFNGGKKSPAPPPAGSNQAPSGVAPADVAKVYGNLTPAARQSYILDYRKSHNNAVPNTDQLVDFISKQTSK